jgi:hypothetical protein
MSVNRSTGRRYGGTSSNSYVAVRAFFDNGQNLFDDIRRSLPAVKVMVEAAMYVAGFKIFLDAAGVAAKCAQVYQGRQIIRELRLMRQEMQAQTALESPEKFATHVYKYINMKTKEVSESGKDLFFLYHPDTDWHPEFFYLVQNKPLKGNFIGLSENLDALCIWMHWIRTVLTSMTKGGHRVRFHLLIPAYRPFIIREPLAFSDFLQPLCIHGLIHNVEPHVMLNLPNAEQGMLNGVGIWANSPSWWQWLGMGEEEAPPRVLGEVPPGVENNARVTREIRRIYTARR